MVFVRSVRGRQFLCHISHALGHVVRSVRPQFSGFELRQDLQFHRHRQVALGACLRTLEVSMRILFYALTACVLSSCNSEPATKPVDPKSVLACMRAQHSNDDYILETRCAPLGPREAYSDTWYVGFEESLFRSDSAQHIAYEIIAPAQIRARVRRNDGGTSALQLSFLGRESRMPGLAGRKVLVLDQLVSIRQSSRASETSDQLQRPRNSGVDLGLR